VDIAPALTPSGGEGKWDCRLSEWVGGTIADRPPKGAGRLSTSPPSPPSYAASTRCSRGERAPELGNLRTKLAHTLGMADQRAKDGRDLCGASDTKKAKKRLAQVRHALGQYEHRLRGKPAQRLDRTLRQRFLQAAQMIAPDVDTLRTHLQCPADAGA